MRVAAPPAMTRMKAFAIALTIPSRTASLTCGVNESNSVPWAPVIAARTCPSVKPRPASACLTFLKAYVWNSRPAIVKARVVPPSCAILMKRIAADCLEAGRIACEIEYPICKLPPAPIAINILYPYTAPADVVLFTVCISAPPTVPTTPLRTYHGI